jgi:hypothetical protein
VYRQVTFLDSNHFSETVFQKGVTAMGDAGQPDDQLKTVTQTQTTWMQWAAALIPVVVAVLVLWLALAQFGPGGEVADVAGLAEAPDSTGIPGADPEAADSGMTQLAERWLRIGEIVTAVALAALAGFAAKVLCAPLIAHLTSQQPRHVNADSAFRSRVAQMVLIWGALAITALTVVIVISFTVLAIMEKGAVEEKVDSLIMGIFTAVLPVLATWVGTVLAFYFTNAAYQTASEASLAAVKDAGPTGPKVTDAMVPYNKIEKIEKSSNDVRKVKISEIYDKMKGPVTRVIVFEETIRRPVFIIRRALLPSDWFTPEGGLKLAESGADKTVDDYIAALADSGDATRFDVVPETAYLSQVAVLMKRNNTDDVFVTPDGQRKDTLGWIPGDRAGLR